MYILVAKEGVTSEFKKFKVVKSIREVLELKQTLMNESDNIIVIKDFSDDIFSAGVYISDLKDYITAKFIYINAKPEAGVKLIITGCSGYYFEEEFYLDDEEELMGLIETLDGTDEDSSCTSLMLNNSIGIITNFMDLYKNNDESVNQPMFLQQVDEAINNLSEITQEQERQIQSLGTTAISIYARASQALKQYKESLDTMTKAYEQIELNLKKSEASGSKRLSFSNMINSFPTYNYCSVPPLLYIREYSSCKYLTSMVMGYAKYLKTVLHKKPKVIFVYARCADLSLKYNSEEFTSITSDNIRSITDDHYASMFVATNYPTKDVLKKLLEQNNDVFIVVDRLYSDTPIISGRVTSVNAVNGWSDINRFKIKPEDTIFSVLKQTTQLMLIPPFNKYPDSKEDREFVYMRMGIDTNFFLPLNKKLKFE